MPPLESTAFNTAAAECAQLHPAVLTCAPPPTLCCPHLNRFIEAVVMSTRCCNSATELFCIPLESHSSVETRSTSDAAWVLLVLTC
jgi:hypothetical protein